MSNIHLYRVQALTQIPSHPWLSRVWARLTQAERAEVLDFVVHAGHLDRSAFEMAVNRMHLDVTDKPKHWKEIQEVLSCANSMAGQELERQG